ncbi:hypothetical protein RUM44_009384 [Polyplax serrata]|uniref:Uncharacterized protein n=1 Tax=Polyplax serrata TaxID=468196 RepID=A0ABR1ASJ0_POLSC
MSVQVLEGVFHPADKTGQRSKEKNANLLSRQLEFDCWNWQVHRCSGSPGWTRKMEEQIPESGCYQPEGKGPCNLRSLRSFAFFFGEGKFQFQLGTPG